MAIEEPRLALNPRNITKASTFEKFSVGCVGGVGLFFLGLFISIIPLIGWLIGPFMILGSLLFPFVLAASKVYKGTVECPYCGHSIDVIDQGPKKPNWWTTSFVPSLKKKQLEAFEKSNKSRRYGKCSHCKNRFEIPRLSSLNSQTANEVPS